MKNKDKRPQLTVASIIFTIVMIVISYNPEACIWRQIIGVVIALLMGWAFYAVGKYISNNN